MARASIRFLRRGRVVELSDVRPTEMLLDYLRLRERSTGTKEGCNEGDCGACTVVLGRVEEGRLVYRPVNACIHPLGLIDGAELVTVEDLAEDGALHPVQEALVRLHGSQCGFCTPGFVMSLFALYHREGARPLDRISVNDALAGNLCRCTGYRPIVDAGMEACAEPADDSFMRRRARTLDILAGLDDGEDVHLERDGGFLAAPASTRSLAALYLAHPDAVLVGGATDAGLWVTKGLREFTKVILLNRIKALAEISDLESELRLGAMVSHARALPHLRRIDFDLGELWRRFGAEQVRAVGTIGGNIANGSPIGDAAPAFIALGATVTLQCGGEGRTIPLEDFFLAYGKQDRRAGEFVLEVAIPKLSAGQAFRCFKVSKRVDEDISAVMAAFRLDIEGRRISRARLAYGGMAPVPKRAVGAEAALTGADLDERSTWCGAIEAIATDFDPIDDHRAGAAYREPVAAALLEKALLEIAGRPTRETRVTRHREAGLVGAA